MILSKIDKIRIDYSIRSLCDNKAFETVTRYVLMT